MCLAIPARVVSLPEPQTAVVDLGGVQKRVSLELVDDVRHYVIVTSATR
jgi:hydrogenase expression/formation protein HypC